MDKIEVTEEQHGLIAQGRARWIERWYGSDPMKGSAIVTEDRSEIAVLGGDEETHKQVRKVVMAHNAGIKALATRTDATPVAEPRTIYVQWADNGNIRKWAWTEFDLAEKLKVETTPVSDTPFAWAYQYTQKHPGQTKPGAMDIKRDRHKGPIASGWTETPLYIHPPATNVAALVDENERLRQALEDVANPMSMIQRQAEAEGSQLSGMAYSIANDLGFVQTIARRALAPFTKGQP